MHKMILYFNQRMLRRFVLSHSCTQSPVIVSYIQHTKPATSNISNKSPFYPFDRKFAVKLQRPDMLCWPRAEGAIMTHLPFISCIVHQCHFPHLSLSLLSYGHHSIAAVIPKICKRCVKTCWFGLFTGQTDN